MIHDISSYLYLIIYILLWIVVCYTHYKNTKFSSGFVVMLSYLIYGILAFVLYSDKLLGRAYSELTLFPFIYLFFMFYIFLSPVIKYEKANVLMITKPSNQIVQIFLIAYSICTFMIVPNMLSSLQEGIYTLLLDSSGGIDLYNESHDNYAKRNSGVSGIYGLFSIFYNIFSDVAKFIFFYYLTYKNKNLLFIVLFFIITIVDLLYPISKGGRTDVIMNLYAILMAALLFFPFYSNRIKSILKKTLILLIVIISIPFMALTISRFGDRDSGTMGGMLSYSGQAPLNFNLNALDAGGTRNGDRTINLFKQFICQDIPEDIPEVRMKYKHLKMDDSIFSTYVGDFVLDFGPVGAFIIFLLLSFYFNSKIRIRNGTISFQSLLLIYFILCIAMQGGMYLFNYSFMGNLTILAFLFMSFMFYLDSIMMKRRDYLQKQ